MKKKKKKNGRIYFILYGTFFFIKDMSKKQKSNTESFFSFSKNTRERERERIIAQVLQAIKLSPTFSKAWISRGFFIFLRTQNQNKESHMYCL